jgi:hypothetical protein
MNNSHEPTTSSCDRPMVTTVRTRREARKNRRMMSNSMTTPSTTAAAKPVASPTRYGSPVKTIRLAASVLGAMPRSLWAKFKMRLARYTSAMPTATSALSRPRIAPNT